VGGVGNECKSPRSALGVDWHVDVPDFAELAEDPQEGVAVDHEVDVVDEQLRESAQILMARAVRRLFLLDRVSQWRQFFARVQHDHLAHGGAVLSPAGTAGL
jgi:hypothetical protein